MVKQDMTVQESISMTGFVVGGFFVRLESGFHKRCKDNAEILYCCVNFDVLCGIGTGYLSVILVDFDHIWIRTII